MKRFASAVIAGIVAVGSAHAWVENFDSYTNGQDLNGVGGWSGWDGDGTKTASVTNAIALSAPNSVEIVGGDDMVQQFPGVSGGKWTVKGDLYVPSNSQTGFSYFILLNKYDPDPSVAKNWAIQVQLDLATGKVENNIDSGSAILDLVRDQWTELRVDIDLDNDWRKVFYNGNLLTSESWTGKSSDPANAIRELQALNLYGAYTDGSPVYWDNLSLERTSVPAVPEPFTMGLAALGLGVALKRRRK